MRDELLRLKDHLNLEIERLGDEAQELVDEYWNQHLKDRENKDRRYREKWPLGVRVRRKGGGVYIEWYRNIFVKNQDGKSKKIFSKHIKKGTSVGYKKSTLERYCENYEFDYVWETEQELSKIRAKIKGLTTLRKYLVLATGLYAETE